MATQRRTDADIVFAVRRMAVDDRSLAPIAIFRGLEHDPLFSTRLPDVRTIERIVRDVRTNDSSGIWSLQHSPPEEAQAVLAMRQAVIEWTDGRVRDLTIDEADWIGRLRVPAADLDLRYQWRLVALYRARIAREQSTADLEDFLGYHPWRSDEDDALYRDALAHGRVPAPPAMLYGDLATRTYGEMERMSYADLEADVSDC